MTPETQRALRAAVENLISQAISLYSQILEAGGQPSLSHSRLQRLFSAARETPRETPIVAYSAIVPHVWFGFQPEAGVSAMLVETKAAHAVDQPDAPHRITVALDAPGTSTWFSLEMELPWSELRLAKSLKLTLVGKADSDLELRAQLRAYQKNGEWCEVAAGTLALERDTKVAVAHLALALPDGVFLDFDREPLLVLFFPLRRLKVEVDRLLVGVE